MSDSHYTPPSAKLEDPVRGSARPARSRAATAFAVLLALNAVLGFLTLILSLSGEIEPLAPSVALILLGYYIAAAATAAGLWLVQPWATRAFVPGAFLVLAFFGRIRATRLSESGLIFARDDLFAAAVLVFLTWLVHRANRRAA